MKNLRIGMLICILLLATSLTVVSGQGEPTLSINNILVTPKPEDLSYGVKTYVSVLDGAGIPIKNLTEKDFSVIEDSVPMKIDSISQANDPISLVVVMDTSGSMAGQSIKSAKEAANTLLLGLGNEDQVAILSFNNQVDPVQDFTKDRQAAGQQLAKLEAVASSGTCLYDAAYQAVQNAAALPPGRRAVILLTDGVDETPAGKACSTYTIDDVIRTATGGVSPIPIFTLGMGTRADQQSLQRLASLTGGYFQYASTSNQLGTIFKTLSDQLKSQYLIEYSTTSGQGNHTVVIEAKTPDGTAKGSRNFIIPAMPSEILIKYPAEGESISGKQTISAALSGLTNDVKKVVFFVGGQEVGQVEAAPYELDFEFNSTFAGNTTVEVVAQGEDGKEIAKKLIQVNVITPTESAPSLPLPKSVSPTYLIGGGAGLLLIAIVVVVVILLRKRKPKVDDFESYGTLEVTFSDDAAFIGKKFEIQQKTTRLGKLVSDNDISFPSDSPVSKHHAIIEAKGSDLYIQEVSQGTTYGTYVQDKKIGSSPVMLRSNDVIQLGNRLKLKVTISGSAGGGTVDNLVIPVNKDKTIDHQLPPKEKYDPLKTQDS